MAQEKILVVDNEIEIIQLIRLHLSRNGYRVVWTTESTKALDLVRKEQPQLILLDVVMPGISGLELCSRIREISSIPILFISCKGKDIDKVMGLSIGGDDYITKPFSPAELTARVQAHLRRRQLNQEFEKSAKDEQSHSMICAGGIEIDLTSHTVHVEGNSMELTVKEYDLLVLLVKYPNRVFTSRQIFDSLWNPYGLEDDVRTVAVHVSNLRKKLESAFASHSYIQTVRGVGYKLVP